MPARSRAPSVDLAALEAAVARAVRSGDALRELFQLRARAAEAAGARRPSKADEARASASYASTHWGLRGERDELRAVRAADPRSGVFVVLGDLISVVYRTRKEGDFEETDYEHEFEGRVPELVYSEAGDHALAIAGGDYTVTRRGIVG